MLAEVRTSGVVEGGAPCKSPYLTGVNHSDVGFKSHPPTKELIMSYINDLFKTAEQLHYDMYRENQYHYIKVSRNMWELLNEYCEKYGTATNEYYTDGSELGKIYGVKIVLDENIETWEII